MSEASDKVVETLRDHVWYFIGNLGVPGMSDRKGYRCYCGWETRDDNDQEIEDPYRHVADKVLEALDDYGRESL